VKERHSVLVVEDEPISAMYVSHLLSADYRVVGVASSGEEAIRLNSEERPELILMDIRLEGGMDGIEAARRIMESSRPHIVFCTAYAMTELGDPVGNGLGEAILDKPLRPERLLPLLADLSMI
jgi:CheY-like chemotaxis protein